MASATKQMAMAVAATLLIRRGGGSCSSLGYSQAPNAGNVLRALLTGVSRTALVLALPLELANSGEARGYNVPGPARCSADGGSTAGALSGTLGAKAAEAKAGCWSTFE